jgi:hypothetical protein
MEKDAMPTKAQKAQGQAKWQRRAKKSSKLKQLKTPPEINSP